jgi:hypothetical protein
MTNEQTSIIEKLKNFLQNSPWIKPMVNIVFYFVGTGFAFYETDPLFTDSMDLNIILFRGGLMILIMNNVFLLVVLGKELFQKKWDKLGRIGVHMDLWIMFVVILQKNMI